MADLPTGTITFLLSDIESSTMLWEQYPQEMHQALGRHDEIIEQIVDAHEGTVVRPRGEGDSRFAVFELASDAVKAAAEIQRALAGGFSGLPFALKVRMGIHTGAASLRVGDYYGTAVNLCARIRGLGHGGQTLLSKISAGIVQDGLPTGLRLLDLGSHQLKGLSRPETIFQLWIADLPNDFPPLQADDAVANNLPAPATEFIGREDEVEQISALLLRPDVRLVTLTGPGGAGKTRLCLEVGHRLLDHFAHGVFFVDLASLVDPALTGTTIARAMGIREGGGRPPLENLMDYLAGKEMLLILDNFEQIIAGATAVSQLQAAAPKIKVLVTSRIALDLRGEHEVPVLSLSIPEGETLPALKDLLEYEAVRLFVERARAIRPTFELTEKNAQAVLGICRRLDGCRWRLRLPRRGSGYYPRKRSSNGLTRA
jgi:class 3 adenylate cyclase